MNWQGRLCIVALLVGLLSCTSTKERGDELLKAGLYSEAIEMYKKALKEDPDDHEAMIAMKKAKQGHIDKGLIEVRMLRMGSNNRSASEKLEDILRKQTKWNINYNSGVSMTMETELKHLSTWLMNKVESSIDHKKPDEARWYQRRFKNILASSSNKLDQTRKKNQKSLGKKNCEKLQSQMDSKSFFYYDFLRRYCQSWQVNWTYKLASADETRFSRVNVKNRVRFRSARGVSFSKSSMDSSVTETFKNSLWYDQSSTKHLNLTLAGKVSYKYSERTETREKTYQIKKSVSEQKAGGQKKQRTVKVEKKHRYQVKLHKEVLNIDVKALSMGGKPSLDISHGENKTHSSESIADTFRAAKIYKTNAKLFDTSHWYKNQVKSFSDKIGKALTQSWQRQFCGIDKTLSETENLIRCLKVGGQSTKIETWFNSNFNINQQQYIESMDNQW